MEVKYNTEFHRWEAYSANPIIRNKQPQPCFVSQDHEACRLYIMRVGAMQ